MPVGRCSKKTNWVVQHMNIKRCFLVVAFSCITATHGVAAEPAGKWRIVNYWSTTCAPCRVEIPTLNRLSIELADANVEVLGVNFDDESEAETLRSLRRMKIEFPNITMAEANALGLAAPNVLPTTYILDPNDAVVDTLIGLQTHEALIERLAELGVDL